MKMNGEQKNKTKQETLIRLAEMFPSVLAQTWIYITSNLSI